MYERVCPFTAGLDFSPHTTRLYTAPLPSSIMLPFIQSLALGQRRIRFSLKPLLPGILHRSLTPQGKLQIAAISIVTREVISSNVI